MTKTTRNLKRRLKAPRDLVEATKKGERFVPTRQIDTRATHVRRFSRAIAAYACVAVVLIAGVAVLPRLLGSEPVPPASAQSSSPLPDALNPPEYVPLSEEQAANYVRPDLIWANELNPELKDFVIWSAEVVDGTGKVTQPLTLPIAGGENAEYAVELKIEYTQEESGESDTTTNLLKQWYEPLKAVMTDIGGTRITEIDYNLSVRPNTVLPYLSTIYAVKRDQLNAMDDQELLSGMNLINKNVRVELRVAWQSCDAEKGLIWSAEIVDGSQAINKPMEIPDADDANVQYVVRLQIEDTNSVMSMGSPNIWKRVISQLPEELKAAGFQTAQMNGDTDTGANVYYSSDYVISRDELSRFDPELILTRLSNVDADLRITISVLMQL